MDRLRHPRRARGEGDHAGYGGLARWWSAFFEIYDDIRIEPAKKVITYAHDGSENGWLIELWKDGPKTTAYLTAASPGSFKGYHLHRVRAARY